MLAAFMSLNFSFGHTPPRPDPGSPFKILVLADFSGRGSRDVHDPESLATRSPLKVDIDNLDERMSRMGIDVEVPIVENEPPIVVHAGSLDDLHPDELLRNVEVFAGLRTTRKRLADPATFQQAAAEMNAWAEPTHQDASDENPFEALLGTDRSESRGVDLSAILKAAIGPHIVPARSPRQDELMDIVDRSTADQLRRVLHDPGFQQVESAWRSVHMLLTTLETGEELEVALLDVTRAELQADLGSGDVSAAGIHRTVAESSGEWSVIAACMSFGPTREDAALLERLGAVARAAGAPLIASASSQTVGCASFDQDPHEWTDVEDVLAGLREDELGQWIALTAPRFLLRQPYGSGSDEIDAFDFEEIEDRCHENYLWGHGSIACARALGEAFSQEGWDLRPCGHADVGGLPVHTWREDGESMMKPCAEAWLTERGVDRLLAAGLIPLVSVQGRDAIRIAGVQSIARTPLACRWGRS